MKKGRYATCGQLNTFDTAAHQRATYFLTPFSYFFFKRALALQLLSEETLRLAMTGLTLLSLLGSASTKRDDRVTHRESCLIYPHAGKLMHS